MLEQLDALGDHVVTGGTGKIECRLSGQPGPVTAGGVGNGEQWLPAVGVAVGDAGGQLRLNGAYAGFVFLAPFGQRES